MKPKNAFLPLLIASAVLTATASAQDGTWIQTTAGPFDWSDAANWLDDTVANGADNTASFTADITETQTVNLDAARTIGNITFTDPTSSHNLTISGANILTLDVTTGPSIINVTQSNRTLTINSEIAGIEGVQKSGPGTLTLGAVNTFTGGFTMNGGITVVGTADTNAGNDVLGAAGTTVSVTAGSTLNLSSVGNFTSDKALSISSGVTLQTSKNNVGITTFSGVLSGASNTTLRNHAGSQIDNRSLVFTNTANTFDGMVNMLDNNATFRFASIGDSVGAGSIRFGNGSVGRTGSFRLDTTAEAAMVLNNRRIEIWTNTNAGGLAQIVNLNTTASNTITINTDLLVTGTGGVKTLEFGGGNTGNNTFAGIIANGGLATLDVTKTGGGTWVLSGANSYNGGTTVSNGTLFLTGATQDTASISVSTNGSLGLDTGFPVTAASAAVDLTGAIKVVGTLGAPSYTLLTAASITGTPVLADPVPGYELQIAAGGTELRLIGSGGASPYDTWSGGATFDGDANGDGVSNGLAFLLGASGPNDSALDKLPAVTETAGGLVITFSMLDSASRGAATLSVEHSSDLGISDAWTEVTVPEASGGPTSGVTFTVSENPGDSDLNDVVATISSSEAASGKLFARLKAVNP